MSHEVPSQNDNYNNPTLSQYDIFNDEQREERIMKKMRHLKELTRLANEGADKKQILAYLRQSQIDALDPAVLTQYAGSDNPVALEAIKQQMLADVSQTDLLATQFSLLWNIHQDIKFIREVYELRRRKGIPTASRFTITAGYPAIKLDFGSLVKDVPSGALTAGTIHLPKRPVNKISIRNRTANNVL